MPAQEQGQGKDIPGPGWLILPPGECLDLMKPNRQVPGGGSCISQKAGRKQILPNGSKEETS